MEKLHLKKIKLHSRESINNWLEHYTGETYILHSELDHIRAGYMDSDKEMIAFVDPPGGPFISIGNVLDEVGKEVESIGHIKGKGFSITFKK